MRQRGREGGREGLGGERDGWTERQREGQTVRGREVQRDGVRGDRDMQSGGDRERNLGCQSPELQRGRETETETFRETLRDRETRWG